MDVPPGHPHGADPRAFLEEVEPRIHDKLEEEIKALGGVKFQLALKVNLRKDNTDGSEEYTDPVLRHKQEALLKPAKSKRLKTKPSPTSWSCLKSGHREGRGGWSTEYRLSGWT